jgi:hypothetical protein
VPGIEVMPFGEESSYDILNAGTILIERPALEALNAKSEAPAATEETNDA